jgi:hypothetical protein
MMDSTDHQVSNWRPPYRPSWVILYSITFVFVLFVSWQLYDVFFSQEPILYDVVLIVIFALLDIIFLTMLVIFWRVYLFPEKFLKRHYNIEAEILMSFLEDKLNEDGVSYAIAEPSGQFYGRIYSGFRRTFSSMSIENSSRLIVLRTTYNYNIPFTTVLLGPFEPGSTELPKRVMDLLDEQYDGITYY